MQNINIKAVVQLTGINENTLRAWERRHQVVEPIRAEDGRRLYSKKDVERLSLLWGLIQEGYLISQIAELPMAKLKEMQTYQVEARPTQKASTVQVSQEHRHLDEIIESLEKFDLNSIHRSLQNAKFELSPKAIVTQLILPLLREVGVRVEDERLNVSQEHLLSSLVRDYLGNLYQSLSPYDYRIPAHRRILLTTREGDLHEFGILLAAILCRINGCETYYLGPNMPVADLALACEKFKVETLILGTSVLPKRREFVTVSQFLKKLDESLPNKVEIFVGGSATFDFNSDKGKRKLMEFKTLQDLDEYLGQYKLRK